MKILSPVDKLNENVNISNTLWSTSRILYPKLAKKCKTDLLLPRRMQLKLAEERSLMEKNSVSNPVSEVMTTKFDLKLKTIHYKTSNIDMFFLPLLILY